MSNYIKTLNYIYWRKEADFIKLDNEAFSKKLEYYLKNGISTKDFSDRGFFLDNKNAYSFTKKENYLNLYVIENGRKLVYTTNNFDNTKNSLNDTGTKAIQELTKKFKERTNLTFCKAFGTCSEDIKKCVPKQFVFTNKLYLNKKLRNISSIDGCSWYPAHMRKTLPTAKSSITVSGTVLPTAEYPFAFYIKSGHSAEYKEYDTHEWVDSVFAPALFVNLEYIKNVKPEDDITVLMKSSGYDLKEEYEYFYALRKTNEEAKLVMNASIGMLHKKNYKDYKYAHLAVVALARANNDHLKMIEKIGAFNIVHICVDGIIYKGNAVYGEKDKSLGVYHQEFVNCEGFIRGLNAYIIQKNGLNVKIKHGAYNKNSDGTDIDESKIKDFKEVYNWVMIDPTKEVIEKWQKENTQEDR